MKQFFSDKNRILLSIVAVLLLAAIIIGIVLLSRSCSKEPEAEVPATIGGGEPIPEETPAETDDMNIELPGYAAITFRAGQKEQELTIPNPAQNPCLLQVSLILEDGTTIWQSELIKPGYYSKPVELIAPIERGEYKNVVMRYDCFTNDAEQKPMNNAQTTLTIIAK